MGSFFQGKTLLITGGSGFVGRNLINRLLETGAKIYVIDKHDTGSLENYPEVTFLQLDISHFQDVKSAIEKVNPNIIFHLASIVTASRDLNLIDTMMEVNLRGTTNILKAITINNGTIAMNGAIAGNQCLECMINFGTSEEYGNQAVWLDETLREEPASPYAILKLTTSRFCNWFSNMYHIPITTVRPANLYGPGQPKDKFIPYIIENCLKNQRVDMTYGEQKRNFIFIDDFIDAILLIAEKERNLGQIYNIGSESSITLRAVVESIMEITHSNPVVNFGAVPYRENEMMVFDLNIDKIKALGWTPQYGLADGLQRTIAYYQSACERAGGGLNNQ